VAQLIKETEDIIGKEKERCTLPKDVDLADLGQTRKSLQNDFSNLSEQIDMLAFENCLLKDQIQVQSDKINTIKKNITRRCHHVCARKEKPERQIQP
jgi:hypothetical protein